MATRNPISTISYNTEKFLLEKLEAWRKAHIIQSYMYIMHKGEDGDKDHIHVRIEPNKTLDPMDLADELQEYKAGEKKPLGCRPFRPSKEEDWVLYAVHDKKYLDEKYKGGEKGEKLPYKWQDIKAPEDFDTEIAFIRAKSKLEHTSSNITNRLKNGESALSLALEGENPYMLNAVLRTLHMTDYENLSQRYTELEVKYNQTCELLKALQEAIEKQGLNIEVDDDGNIIFNPFK